MKDLILSRIGDSIQSQVDGDQEQSIERIIDDGSFGDLVFIDGGIKHESRDTDGDQGHTKVFVGWKLASI